MHDDIERILQLWLIDAFGNYHINPVVFHIEGDSLWIITKRPGPMIGYHGSLIGRYKELLKAKGYDFKFKFVEFGLYPVFEF